MLAFAHKYQIDSSILKGIYLDPLAYLEVFYSNNPSFQQLDQPEATELVRAVFEVVLKDPYFAQNNPDNIIVKHVNDNLDLINELNQDQAVLTNQEILLCLGVAVIAYVADNFQLIKTLFSVLKGERLTFGVVKAAFQLFFPEAKIATTVAAFLGCVWIEYFD